MKIVFLLPGRTATMNFAISLCSSVNRLMSDGHNLTIVNDYSADIYNCRNALLLPAKYTEGGIKRPAKPFNGKLEYDVLLWIDSDMVFTPDDVETIINHADPVVSGICPVDQNRAGLARYASYQEGTPEGIIYFNTKDNNYAEMEKTGLFEVDFAGFAFIAVKRGVFEEIEYPWFRHKDIDLDGKQIVTSEDFGMCERIRDAGFKIFADPKVRIGHEKNWVLRP